MYCYSAGWCQLDYRESLQSGIYFTEQVNPGAGQPSSRTKGISRQAVSIHNRLPCFPGYNKQIMHDDSGALTASELHQQMLFEGAFEPGLMPVTFYYTKSVQVVKSFAIGLDNRFKTDLRILDIARPLNIQPQPNPGITHRQILEIGFF